MNELTTIWRQAGGLVRAAIVQLLLYDLLFKLIGLLVLTPLSAMALDRLLAASGSLSVTNADQPGGYLLVPEARTIRP